MVRLGVADVEVHLHHDHDTAASMRDGLRRYTRTLRERHGLLRDGATGPAFAFIHGNWVLGNSGQRGAGCGVDDELVVLDEAGCYADFTLPSAPHPSQPPVINRIYYAAGVRERARAHFRGIDARLGVPGIERPAARHRAPGDQLEAEAAGAPARHRERRSDRTNPPTPDRVDAWIRCGDRRWRTSRAGSSSRSTRTERRSAIARTLLGDGAGSLSALFSDLLARYNDGERYVLHFSSPWEMYRAVKVLEANDKSAISAIERFEFPF